MITELVTALKEEDFATFVEDSPIALVDFWAAWCGPCKMMSPVVDDVAADFGSSLKVAKVNVDESHNVAASYGVMNIPTLILFKDGQEYERVVGYQSKEDLVMKIRKAMK